MKHSFVIPAKAGIHCLHAPKGKMDPRFRGDDKGGGNDKWDRDDKRDRNDNKSEMQRS
jgi:hypothetical protein